MTTAQNICDVAVLSTDESDQRLASVKSQYDQQVTQLQRDLEEARRGAAAAAGPAEQLQQEKERLASENAELQSKVSWVAFLFFPSLLLFSKYLVV